jgi:hypothetical protein
MTPTNKSYGEIAFRDLMNDLRRLLYLNTITSVTLDAILNNPYCIGENRKDTEDLKKAIRRQISAIGIVKTELKLIGTSESWHVIEEDFTSERIEDIGVLIDFISGVKNVAEVTKVLQEIFNEQLKAKQHAKA